jgi:hypothetical protein
MFAHYRSISNIILYHAVKVAAAPVDTSANSTQTPSFVGYVSEPNIRGTTTLVISCLLTLVLCVWSALHLNVPEEDATHLRLLLLNIRWIITGVYAPELVVFTAWRQWASARILGTLVNELAREFKKGHAGSPSSIPALQVREHLTTSHKAKPLYKSVSFADHRHRWTKTHDFFASTGGFAFEISSSGGSKNAHSKFLPDTCPTRVTLTARGVAFLAKCNRLPDIPEKDILDKSKGNHLAKALVVIQAAWMLLQTLGRLIVRLPVTLLEVNTCAHV